MEHTYIHTQSTKKLLLSFATQKNNFLGYNLENILVTNKEKKLGLYGK